jgi:NAD(P)-dependent dehydrogenase (short-subunit alcohol dehydrogenase family)
MIKQVILVTGASSGFGLMAAQHLARAGHTVYASMRAMAGRNAPQVASIKNWAAEQQADLRTVELDVQSDASVSAGIAAVLTEAGRLDTIVHNAGHMVFGPAEAFTAEQYMQQYDVNVLGAQRVNRAARPHLRRQGSGLLVWVGSSSTRGGTPPFLGPYFAAKAAMDALAVTYSSELARWGIETTIIVPGASRKARTTLHTPARLLTKPASPSMTRALMRASLIRHSRDSPAWSPSVRIRLKSLARSCASSLRLSASARSACTSIHPRTEPKW